MEEMKSGKEFECTLKVTESTLETKGKEEKIIILCCLESELMCDVLE